MDLVCCESSCAFPTLGLCCLSCYFTLFIRHTLPRSYRARVQAKLPLPTDNALQSSTPCSQTATQQITPPVKLCNTRTTTRSKTGTGHLSRLHYWHDPSLVVFWFSSFDCEDCCRPRAQDQAVSQATTRISSKNHEIYSRAIT